MLNLDDRPDEEKPVKKGKDAEPADRPKQVLDL